jgi:CheY-like chemotaxis protein
LDGEGDVAHILLIEDDTEVVQFTRSLLDQEGYNLEIATDGESGLAAYMRRRPDLILLDVFVPRLDGLRFAREIRQRFPSDHVPVVVWTGAYEPERMGDLVRTPHVLPKPVDSAELLEVVRRALNQDDVSKRKLLRVLCVSESVPRLRALVRELRTGFDVHTASRWEEVPALLDVHVYEGLVVDVSGAEGVAVLQAAAARHRDIGRIALGGDPELETSGAVDAVLPLDHAEGALADRLHAILG